MAFQASGFERVCAALANRPGGSASGATRREGLASTCPKSGGSRRTRGLAALARLKARVEVLGLTGGVLTITTFVSAAFIASAK